MDDARKLLDSLMGPSRDKSLQEQQRGDGWKDRNVCKRYLVGFCPNNCQDNWFKNTRRDTGSCTKVHSESLKKLFEEHPDRARYEAEYEKEFLTFLEGLIFEADAWIGREKRNCKPPGKEMRMPPHVKQAVAEMQDQSEKLMKQAEDLAEKGDLSESKQAVQKATQLNEDVEELKTKYTFVSGGEEVCEVCGVRCQPGEAADYQAHLDGKLHEGYTRIREKVKELRDRQRNPARRGREEHEPQEEKGRERGAERERDRDRDRQDRDNRERNAGRNRGSGGDGGGRDRGRERRRDRSRSRDRRRGTPRERCPL